MILIISVFLVLFVESNKLPKAYPSRMVSYPMRLGPSEDILQTFVEFVQANKLRAVTIQAIVGSVKRAILRLANQDQNTIFDSGTYEIVSLVGTISANYNETTREFSDIIPHVHLSISDGKTGQTFGGHMMFGCIVYTTAEIVLNELVDVYFEREIDPNTGYDELVIIPRN